MKYGQKLLINYKTTNFVNVSTKKKLKKCAEIFKLNLKMFKLSPKKKHSPKVTPNPLYLNIQEYLFSIKTINSKCNNDNEMTFYLLILFTFDECRKNLREAKHLYQEQTISQCTFLRYLCSLKIIPRHLCHSRHYFLVFNNKQYSTLNRIVLMHQFLLINYSKHNIFHFIYLTNVYTLQLILSKQNAPEILNRRLKDVR